MKRFVKHVLIITTQWIAREVNVEMKLTSIGLVAKQVSPYMHMYHFNLPTLAVQLLRLVSGAAGLNPR